jgi:hypothetical protein
MALVGVALHEGDASGIVASERKYRGRARGWEEKVFWKSTPPVPQIHFRDARV